MRALLCIVGFAALVSTGSVFADEVDFRTLNPILQTLVDATIQADSQSAGKDDATIEFAYPHFDESQCDLKAEKLKYDLLATVKNTPWTQDGKDLITATSTYAADHTVGHTGIQITLQANAKTDVLALIRYSAKVALAKRTNEDPQFDDRVNAHLNRLKVARSLNEVYQLMVSGQILAKDKAQRQIDDDQMEYDCYKSGKCPLYGADLPEVLKVYQNEVTTYKGILKQISSLGIQIASKDGDVQSITLNTTSINMMLRDLDQPHLEVGSTQIVFASDAVSLDNKSFYVVNADHLNQLKNDFQTRLIGVQNGNADQKEYIQQRVFREALIEFKKTLIGGFAE